MSEKLAQLVIAGDEILFEGKKDIRGFLEFSEDFYFKVFTTWVNDQTVAILSKDGEAYIIKIDEKVVIR